MMPDTFLIIRWFAVLNSVLFGMLVLIPLLLLGEVNSIFLICFCIFMVLTVTLRQRAPFRLNGAILVAVVWFSLTLAFTADWITTVWASGLIFLVIYDQLRRRFTNV